MSLEKLLLFPIYWTNNNCSVSSPNIWKILLICCMKELSDKKIETPVHLCCADLYLSITQEKLIKIQSEFIKIDWQKQHNKKKKKAFVSRLTLELLFCTTRKKTLLIFLQCGFISQCLLSDQHSLVFLLSSPLFLWKCQERIYFGLHKFPCQRFCQTLCQHMRWNSVFLIRRLC